MSDRFEQLIARIDTLNSQDPNTETVDSHPYPRELLYAERLTEWVLRLNPDASEALRIAARGQHVQRWTIARDQYTRDRRGYLQWREALKQFHAKTVGAQMREAGYPDELIEHVRLIITKKHLSDPDTQTIEDALCLVFLERQFKDLRATVADAKMIDVLRKSWQKMSPKAREVALSLPLDPKERQLLDQALAG